MELSELPIVNISGPHGPGLAAAMQQVVRHFAGQGIRVELIPRGRNDSPQALSRIACGADLVLTENSPIASLPQFSFGAVRADGAHPAADEVSALVDAFGEYVSGQWLNPSVTGCLLIGGRSSRMGRPKHLIREEGITWLQRTANRLAQVADRVVVAGQGELEDSGLPRLNDANGCSGPLAGILAALQAFPWSTILACACDMPDLTGEALAWLLEQRRPGRWAVIPRVGGRLQPLLALYDFRIRSAVEAMGQRGVWRMSALAEAEGVTIVEPPSALAGAWRNVNTPAELPPRSLADGCFSASPSQPFEDGGPK